MNINLINIFGVLRHFLNESKKKKGNFYKKIVNHNPLH